jgi:BirA family biotin operon repressor/biotin-[acetyl-CoA-carboxylase] ligase
VKWPNDILIDTKKVAGILTEINANIDYVNHVICGIGVNLNEAPKGDEPGLNAVSLSDKNGALVSRAVFARTLYSSVEKWYKVFLKDGFASVAGVWREYFNAEGKPVSIRGHERSVEGICMGIDETGALLVRESSGRVTAITSGDMVLT